MAFDIAGAKAAGYSQDEINQYLGQKGNPLSNTLGAIKGFGGGAIQDILAPAYLAGQEVMHGQSPIAGLGNNPNTQQLNEYASNNPFATHQQLQKMGGVKQVAQDTAGAASYLTPLGTGGILARLGLGAGAGGLQGASQDNATPGSIATGAALGGTINGAFGLAGKAGSLPTKLANSIQKRIAQSHFGLQAAENPDVAALAHSNPIQSFNNVMAAAQNTSGKVRNYLDQKTGNIDDFIDNLVNAGQNVPPAARGGLHPDVVAPAYRQWLENIRDQVASDMEQKTGHPLNFSEVKDVPLSFMNDVKAAIGKHYETDPVAKEMYGAARNYITKQFGQMPKDLQQLWSKQQALINASSNSKKLLQARGIPHLGGAEGALGELAGPTASAIAFLEHAPIVGSALAGVSAIQHQMKNPKVASAVKTLLEQPSKAGNTKVSKGVGQILQQAGIRLPIAATSPTQ